MIRADFPKREILRQMNLQRCILLHRPDDPHRAASLRQNTKDERLVQEAPGNTLGEMQALARKQERKSTLKAALFGYGTLQAGGLMVAGLAAGAAIPLVGGVLATVFLAGKTINAVRSHHQAHETLNTLSRWEFAINHQPFRMLG